MRIGAIAPIVLFGSGYLLYAGSRLVAGGKPGTIWVVAMVATAGLTAAVIWFTRTLDEVHQAIAAQANAVAFWATFLVLFAFSVGVPDMASFTGFAPLWTIPVASWLVGYAVALWRSR